MMRQTCRTETLANSPPIGGVAGILGISTSAALTCIIGLGATVAATCAMATVGISGVKVGEAIYKNITQQRYSRYVAAATKTVADMMEHIAWFKHSRYDLCNRNCNH